MSKGKRKHGKSSSHRPAKQRRHEQSDQDVRDLCENALKEYKDLVKRLEKTSFHDAEKKKSMRTATYMLVNAIQLLTLDSINKKLEGNKNKTDDTSTPQLHVTLMQRLLKCIGRFYGVNGGCIDNVAVNTFSGELYNHFKSDQEARMHLFCVAVVVQMVDTMFQAKPTMANLQLNLSTYGDNVREKICTIEIPNGEHDYDAVLASIQANDEEAIQLRRELASRKTEGYSKLTDSARQLYYIEMAILVDLFALKLLLEGKSVDGLHDLNVDACIATMIKVLTSGTQLNITDGEAEDCLKFIYTRVGNRKPFARQGLEIRIVSQFNKSIISVMRVTRKSKSDQRHTPGC